MTCPCKVTELVPGQLVAGFIVKVDTYGVLVRFRDALTALVPRPNIADKVYPLTTPPTLCYLLSHPCTLILLMLPISAISI